MAIHDLVSTLFEGYRSLNQQHPVLGGILTAEVVFPLADMVSQYITQKCINWRKVGYTSALAVAYGAYTTAAVASGELVGRYFCDNPLAQAALGPNLLGNAFNMFFFANNTVGEHSDYSLETLARHYARAAYQAVHHPLQSFQENIWSQVPKREYLNSVIGTLTFWNAFFAANYRVVPRELQTPAALGAALGWTVFLSLWSLRGAKKKETTRPETGPKAEVMSDINNS